jgi:CheY-like chemotaxis protein
MMHPPVSEGKSVLIVEDDNSIREVLQMFLEYEGYCVMTAANGQEGIEALSRGQSPCLIVLDLMMPIMDGWQFVESIAKNATFAAIPIVVVTAFIEKAQEIKAKLVVKKPIDLNDLLKIVQQYCGMRKK